MLEKTSQAFKKLIVTLIFILAIALLICTISVLFSVLTLAVIATLTNLVIAPKETRQFFAKAAQCIDSWVQAMVKMVTEAGELVKDLMRQNKTENKKDETPDN